MSRTLRIEYPGAVYHVQSEGNRGDAIYLDDEDRETFLRTFQEAARRSGWTVYAYALMANHYRARQSGRWHEMAPDCLYPAF